MIHDGDDTQGIGLAIVRQLALQYPRSSFNNGRLLIYLAARDQGRGRAAVEELLEDKQLTAAKALGSSGGLADIEYAQLDISSSESIEKFADLLKQRHGQIDFFVGNAGIALTGFGEWMKSGADQDQLLAQDVLHCRVLLCCDGVQELPRVGQYATLSIDTDVSPSAAVHSPSTVHVFVSCLRTT